MHLKSILIALALSVLPAFAGTAEKEPWICGTGLLTSDPYNSVSPYQQWEASKEVGYMWQMGRNTSIDYEFATAIFSLRSPVTVNLLHQDNGNALIVRTRTSIIADYVVEGPEDYIVSLVGAPSIEYWFADDKFAFYFSPGGGIGITNSKGVSDEGGPGIEGGQGQDFILTWTVQAGLRYQIDPTSAITAGAVFQHVSNGGQTDVNPGIDAMGFTVGYTCTF